jgi:hypothetical protein
VKRIFRSRRQTKRGKRTKKAKRAKTSDFILHCSLVVCDSSFFSSACRDEENENENENDDDDESSSGGVILRQYYE